MKLYAICLNNLKCCHYIQIIRIKLKCGNVPFGPGRWRYGYYVIPIIPTERLGLSLDAEYFIFLSRVHIYNDVFMACDVWVFQSVRFQLDPWMSLLFVLTLIAISIAWEANLTLTTHICYGCWSCRRLKQNYLFEWGEIYNDLWQKHHSVLRWISKIREVSKSSHIPRHVLICCPRGRRDVARSALPH